jgi:uncharacterized membrane protein YagU involved in acid resistance
MLGSIRAEEEILRLNSLLVGAVAGALATLPMTMVMSRLSRELSDVEEEDLPPETVTENLSSKLGAEGWVEEVGPGLAASIVHYGAGAVAGAAYGPLSKLSRGQPVASGIGYGIAVWAASYGGWLPALRLYPPLKKQSRRRAGLILASHIVWGATLGVLVAATRAVEEASEEAEREARRQKPRPQEPDRTREDVYAL